MKRAAAIITDHGGRTSHAAIVSRELGLQAIIGTCDATHVLHNEQEVTVLCAEGDEGFVYEGRADYEAKEIDLESVPVTRTPGDAQPRQPRSLVPQVTDSRRRRRASAYEICGEQPH